MYDDCNYSDLSDSWQNIDKEQYMKYDFLVVGAGLFGAIFAYEAKK